MNDIKSKIKLNMELTEKILVNFIREEVRSAGFEKVVLGLSGGIDSAIVAFLAVKALGPENVLGIMMPYKSSSRESLEDAQRVVEATGMRVKKIEITDMVDAYFAKEPDISDLRKGNKMARERMTILYDYSAKEKSLVLGTSNKTEILLGYSTQWGDSASAINPIGDLLKTQVWELSEYMGIPKEVIEKKPSADLWEGQSDEDELGFSYFLADEIINLLVDERYTKEEILEKGYSEKTVDSILWRIKTNQYKRKLPLIAKISNRTMEREFRYPRDWGI
ncbi:MULTISPECIES: NAD+ synthase [Psychrilyobacter]|uniref:NH(3)-dependent NAD(+) synthetase n=1 Tax=Psychrilyobacter piezotolerans TaxID=2293438 RepID=A0ABX9KL77_9FUSO|nr:MULTISPECIES: NAD+ synthase [Psychrilyobacter]MCS5421478.1 NAD+ synthase [Psychrilyobacter sp. S5]NDI76546.1 NAD+ synthase [Psychrilyobacter piezotolerans]RDE66137.1 NAD+ synthase [Psychrilyobacter sp. S5]REI43315.1 NAD+ synthase [Psychrilyobacter piezotolerans]